MEQVVREVVRRIVEHCSPERVILFGSAVREDGPPPGDLDLAVIHGNPGNPRDLAERLYGTLWGIPMPVDILVFTPEDLSRFGDRPGTIIPTILREGKVVYERARA